MTKPVLLGIDVIAGFSTTSGADDYYIDGPSPRARSILQHCIHDVLYGYIAGPTSLGAGGVEPGYEYGIARWDATNRRLRPIEIRGSSNGGQKNVWPPGEKLIQITAFSDMLTDMDYMVEGADALILTAAERQKINTPVLNAGGITPLTTIAGTEILIGHKNGLPVGIPVQKLLNDPLHLMRGPSLDRIHGYTDFRGLPLAVQVDVDGQFIGQENFQIYLAGAGAFANRNSLFVTNLGLNTGTTATGRCAAVHTHFPLTFLPGMSGLDQRWEAELSHLPTVGNNFIVHLGFVSGAMGALPAGGFYFELPGANQNWQMIVKNNAGTHTVNTGIAPVLGKNTFRKAYDAALLRYRYWINGVELPFIAETVRALDMFMILSMVASIRNTAGTQNRTLTLYHHRYDHVGTATAPAHFE